jgi:hypothetical protein
MASLQRDENSVAAIGGTSSVTDTAGSIKSFQYDPSTRGILTHIVGGGGLIIEPYDYVSMALSGADTTETYTFKTGGSGGTTVATITIVYTDDTRSVLSSVTKS